MFAVVPTEPEANVPGVPMNVPPSELKPEAGVRLPPLWFVPQTTIVCELPTPADLFAAGQAPPTVAADEATTASVISKA